MNWATNTAMGRERNKASQAGEMAGAQVQGWDCVQCDGEAMRSELGEKLGSIGEGYTGGAQ